MKHSKVIVWGAKPDTGHTHAFVHHAIVRAGDYLGIPIYWLDNRDNLAEEFFDDALIISEQWLVFANGNSNNLPLESLPLTSFTTLVIKDQLKEIQVQICTLVVLVN